MMVLEVTRVTKFVCRTSTMLSARAAQLKYSFDTFLRLETRAAQRQLRSKIDINFRTF